LPQRHSAPARLNLDVPELARSARRSPVHLPIEHDGGADSAGDLEVDDVTEATHRSEERFAKCSEVRVVVNLDVQPESRCELVGGLQPDPAGKEHRGLNGSCLTVDRARQAHACPDQLVARDSSLA
jgi:hypothetical protein